MPRSNKLIEKRNTQIVDAYNKLSNKKLKPWRVYEKLRQKFFLTNRMLDCIISGEFERKKAKQNQPQNPNQLTIFSHEKNNI
jgi:hypothetical protein